jgi:aspartate 4-decarboxylase
MDHTPSIVRQVHYSGFEAYEKLSPFEIKDGLIKLARERPRKSDIAFFNAGAAIRTGLRPRRAQRSSCIGQFALQESKGLIL